MTRRSEPERIDAPLMRGLLSPEEVTSGDLQNIAFMLDNLLETNGTKSTVNGVPARVSVVEVETPIPGEADQESKSIGRAYFALIKEMKTARKFAGWCLAKPPVFLF